MSLDPLHWFALYLLFGLPLAILAISTAGIIILRQKPKPLSDRMSVGE